MRKRAIRRQVWLNEEEDKEFFDKVAKSGLTPSDFLRYLIKNCELKEKPQQEFYDELKKLRGVGNNLNQIARYANANSFVDGVYLKKQIDIMNGFIVDIKKNYLLPTKKDGDS